MLQKRDNCENQQLNMKQNTKQNTSAATEKSRVRPAVFIQPDFLMASRLFGDAAAASLMPFSRSGFSCANKGEAACMLG